MNISISKNKVLPIEVNFNAVHIKASQIAIKYNVNFSKLQWVSAQVLVCSMIYYKMNKLMEYLTKWYKLSILKDFISQNYTHKKSYLILA